MNKKLTIDEIAHIIWRMSHKTSGSHFIFNHGDIHMSQGYLDSAYTDLGLLRDYRKDLSNTHPYLNKMIEENMSIMLFVGERLNNAYDEKDYDMVCDNLEEENHKLISGAFDA